MGQQRQSSWKLRREEDERERATRRDLACQDLLEQQLSFPYRKCPGHFRLLFRYLPHTRRAPSHLPEAEVGRGKSCGPLWRILVFLSSIPGQLVEWKLFVCISRYATADGAAMFLKSWNTSSPSELL